MKILWVKAGGFLPLDSGGKIRSYNIVRHLAQSHAVTVFTFYPASEADQTSCLQKFVQKAICIRMPVSAPRGPAQLIRYARRFFSHEPYAFLRYCQTYVAVALRDAATTDSFDVIVCDFLLSCGVIPWDLATPKVLFTHNVETLIWRRHYQTTRNWFKKIVFWREWHAMKRTEQKYLKQANTVLTVSDVDREIFAQFVDPGGITTIPTGVDTEYFISSNRRRKPFSLVFTGSMDWLPNEDAILFFLEQILPQIRLTLPLTELTIVGRYPSSKLKTVVARHRHVQLTGQVDDVRPYVDEAEVYIVPLRIGSGTRLKIFEAMSMGKAVVTTTIGAEGLPVVHGANVLIADSPEEFAESVIRLQQNAGLRRKLERSARALVEGEYSWDRVSERFAQSLEESASTRNADVCLSAES